MFVVPRCVVGSSVTRKKGGKEGRKEGRKYDK
jgi:hypothetical protein